MANIMLTDSCNLNCSYCFANEFVHRAQNEISIEAFKEALDFVATEKNNRLGLIGGEPTLHSQFKLILQTLINDSRFKNVVIFTNAIELDSYAKELTNSKFKLLINCNSPNDIGKSLFAKMCSNIDLLIKDYYLKDRITLGVNIYKKDFDYDYILEILKKYGMHQVRISIAVPNDATKREFNVAEYFLSFKPRLKEFLYAILSNDIIPFYDCNKMPTCMFDGEEIAFLKSVYEKIPPVYKNDNSYFGDNSIFTDRVTCSPVVDIRQDLTAIRCFGLSDCTKVNIRDFLSIGDLRNYYLNLIDCFAYKFGIADRCNDCYKQKTMICSGGCIAYKINRIIEASQALKVK